MDRAPVNTAMDKALNAYINKKLHDACENFIHIKQGYCYYSLAPDANPYIFGLYIEPEYRRQGYAKKLLNAVINIIKTFKPESPIDIKAVPKENSISEQRLIQFYTDLGLNVLANASEQV